MQVKQEKDFCRIHPQPAHTISIFSWWAAAEAPEPLVLAVAGAAAEHLLELQSRGFLEALDTSIVVVREEDQLKLVLILKSFLKIYH
jgi:hypothetical protein